jgi:hypothetical protein
MELEKEIKEINRKLDLILKQLSIGEVPPVSVFSLKDRARKKALELKVESGGNIEHVDTSEN